MGLGAWEPAGGGCVFAPDSTGAIVNDAAAHSEEHERLIRKLESIADLTPEERDALRGLPLSIKDVAADEEIVTDGDRPSQCCLLLDGFLGSYKMLPDGGRQIMAFWVAGDVPDLQSLHLHVMDHSIGAMIPSRVAFIKHTALLELIAEHPGIGAVLWRETLIDGAVFREWLVNIGRRAAYTRLAHILCELFIRLRAVGLASDEGFELPLTQLELGDALGLSTVHVNRSMQELRKDGLIVSKSRFVSIPDWEALVRAGDFDPTYLHMRTGR